MKIIGIYKITNTVTGDFYIGSSKDVRRRWKEHKCQSTWNKCPNNPMYLDMQEYGKDKFVFEVLEVLEVVEADSLKETEQKFIEMLKPAYNNYNSKGWNIERQKKSKKEYKQSDKGKKSNKKYQQSDRYKKYQKEYEKSDKGKKAHKKAQNKYDNQLCFYNGKNLTLAALATRFRRAGIEHPTIEAKKYLLVK